MVSAQQHAVAASCECRRRRQRQTARAARAEQRDSFSHREVQNGFILSPTVSSHPAPSRGVPEPSPSPSPQSPQPAKRSHAAVVSRTRAQPSAAARERGGPTDRSQPRCPGEKARTVVSGDCSGCTSEPNRPPTRRQEGTGPATSSMAPRRDRGQGRGRGPTGAIGGDRGRDWEEPVRGSHSAGVVRIVSSSRHHLLENNETPSLAYGAAVPFTVHGSYSRSTVHGSYPPRLIGDNGQWKTAR